MTEEDVEHDDQERIGRETRYPVGDPRRNPDFGTRRADQDQIAVLLAILDSLYRLEQRFKPVETSITFNVERPTIEAVD